MMMRCNHKATTSLFWKEALSRINLEGKTVLDAGTGRESAKFLAEKRPKHLLCITLPGDLRKGKGAEDSLRAIGFKDYKLIYGDLADSKSIKKRSIDFVLGHLFLGELADSKFLAVLTNLFAVLRKEGDLVLVDREPYYPFVPSFKYIAMGKIKGKPELRSRSNRDLIEIASLFMSIPKNLMLLSPGPRGREVPSDWILNILKEAGFANLRRSFFDVQANIRKEFEQTLTWAKQRIDSLKNQDLRSGLMKELTKVVRETRRRRIPEDDCFFRRCYIVHATKH